MTPRRQATLHSRRIALGGAALAAALTMAMLGAELPASASAAWLAPAGRPVTVDGLTAGTTYYAVGVHVCKKPRSRLVDRCFAMRRKIVSRTTPGAVPFELAGGATSPRAVGPAGGLTPSDLASAYRINPAGGSGQTIALVDAYNDPNIGSDLSTFDLKYGLPACTIGSGCLKVVGQTGTTALPPNDTTGWSTEEALDVETAHAICEKCKLMLVEANAASNSALGAAENEAARLGANEISNSFGAPEAGSSSTFQSDFNHAGIVITAASGDDGYYSFDQLNDVSMPNIPAAFPTVVSVGGTSLFLTSTGARRYETVWNGNGPGDVYQQYLGSALGASGGGCSLLFGAEPWQRNASGYGAAACGGKRLENDVAALADPFTGFDIYDTYNCGTSCRIGWQTLGGTSLATPIVAAMYGLAGGAHGVKYPSLTLYGHLGKFYDVTVGGNGACDGEGAAQCGDLNLLGYGVVDCAYTASGSLSTGDAACDAQKGFDGPSGVGTPNGLTGFGPTGPSGTVSGPSSIAVNTSGTWKVSGRDPFPGGKISSYSFNWGDGSALTKVTSSSLSHSYKKTGAFTLTVTLADNYGRRSKATYTVKVT